MKLKTAAIMLASATIAASCDNSGYLTDNLGVTVKPEENREYSYTDKKAGYWYGTTLSTPHLADWFCRSTATEDAAPLTSPAR